MRKCLAKTWPNCGILNKHVTAEPSQFSTINKTPSATTNILARWNKLVATDAVDAILPCCGSRVWAEALAAHRPLADQAALLAESDAAWQSLGRADWQQAFDSHPRLGETHAKAATAASLSWSSEEQSKAAPASLLVEAALREANARYEQKFGRIFLFCANGRTAPEILAAIERRMDNDAETEWREAGEQQRQITRLRLERWLRGS